MEVLLVVLFLSPFLFFAWIDREGGINGPGK